MSNTELTVHKGELLEMVMNDVRFGRHRRYSIHRYAPIRTAIYLAINIIYAIVSSRDTVYEIEFY